MSDEFTELAADLRQRLLAHYESRGEALEGRAGLNTLETNSGLVPRRGRPLVEILRARAGRESLAGAAVADLGCGFGGLSVYFASLGANVVGIDVNGARLDVPEAVCAAHGLSARFAQAPMQRLPLQSASVDIAIMNNSLCYLTDRGDRNDVLSEARRVLRPGGHLLIRNPNRFALVDPFTALPLLGVLPQRWQGWFAASLGRPRSEVLLLSIAAARRELKRAGMTAVEEVPSPGNVRPAAVRVVARYQHLLARRPGV
jgi:SAM-dependent methyltransferase